MSTPLALPDFTDTLVSGRSIVDLITPRLARLCEALALDLEVATRLLRTLTEPWGDRAAEPCRWPSDVGDDHSPCELSLVIADVPELRVMVEPLGEPPSLEGNRDAALGLLERLARDSDHQIDLSRLHAIGDLFLPDQPSGRFAIWVAATLSRNASRPQFKVYLDPQARGPGQAMATLEECLVRLGFGRAWDALARVLIARGPVLDQLTYLSLDLADHPSARLKIYARHQHATPDDLERAAADATASRSGEARDFAALLVPGLRVFDGRAPFTCWSFVAGSDRPASATTHIPVNGYVRDDADARRRFLAVLEAIGLEPGAYERALEAFRNRPLEAGVGLQSYMSFRREPGGPRLTVYLPLELYRRGCVAPPTSVPDPSDAHDIVKRFEQLEPITIHPMLQRLAREPVSPARLWTVLANFQISVSLNFARHLANITARVDDDRVRSILAHQLDDELGNGAPERAHVRLFAAMMERLVPWQPEVIEERLWVPGRRFDERLRAVYEANDPWEAVGAVMVGEIYGKQIDLFLGEQLRRQTEIDTESLEWLVLHERLEVEHAEDSDELAAYVPRDALPAVWRGAQAAGRAGYGFLDDLYSVCFA